MHIPKKLLTQLNTHNEKIVILSSEGEPMSVLMSYEAYIGLLEGKNAPILNSNSKNSSKNAQNPLQTLTSNDLLDKINHEIAQWKEHQNPGFLDDNYFSEEEDFDVNEDDRVYLESIDD